MNHNGEKIERLMDPYLPLHNFYDNIYLKFVYIGYVNYFVYTRNDACKYPL